jgi:Aerotolerance regulator N-terminal
MSVAAPWFLYATAIAAAAVAGLHFLVSRPPQSTMLPTARFVPASVATIVRWGRRPSDAWLLVLRIALLGLVGTAFARPSLAPARASLLRIVVADRSRAVANIAEVRDSVRRVLRTGDVLIVFDSRASCPRRQQRTQWPRSLVAAHAVSSRRPSSPPRVRQPSAATKRTRSSSIS